MGSKDKPHLPFPNTTMFPIILKSLFISPKFAHIHLYQTCNFISTHQNLHHKFTNKRIMSFSKRIPMLLLRLLALGASVSAIVVMVTSHDSAQVFNMKFDAKYSNTPTFK